MFNPNNDRLDYGSILTPPFGYTLDFAVGTTYSLDLDALVGACLALGLSEETDSELLNNSVYLLEALRRTGDKIALFCENGQIHKPNKITPLYILLEKIVFSVKTENRSGIAGYPSFHPKCWLLRFRQDDKIQYRIIILSRNLTFDRSWDIVYFMDGFASEQQTDKNEPLCDFLRFLQMHLSDDENGRSKAASIESMIRDLSHIVFQPSEKQFYDYEFIPGGVKNHNGEYYRFDKTPLFQNTFHEILIMSPFLSNSIVRNFNDRNNQSLIKDPRYMLITREMSLRKLKPEDVSNFKTYALRDAVVDGESTISDGSRDIRKQDIHAKLYMIRKYSDTDLYLGSLNASRNAVYGNIEFMIRLRSQRRYLNMESLAASLFGAEPDSSSNPFQEMTVRDADPVEEETTNQEMTDIIRNIARGSLSAAVEPSEEFYSVTLHFGRCDTQDYYVEVSPLLSVKTMPFGEEVRFTGLSASHLSEFYLLSVSDGEQSVDRILKIPTTGLPEDREKMVVSGVISNKDNFYRYIAFLLGEDALLSMLETDAAEGEKRYSSKGGEGIYIPALYEKMLRTASEAPEKFSGIEYLMKTIPEEGIIPEEFRQLFETFRKAVKWNG